jgi:hypothetical protein
MWRKLGKILAAIVATLILLFVASWTVRTNRSIGEHEEQQAADRAARVYGVRLRADGDRLAKAGEWEDALSRYNQAADYDRGLDDNEKMKLQVIKEHVGEVVWDEEYEAHGRPR